MKISAITVSFNSQATIGYTIESFLKQRYADKELLVIDGASTDQTLDIIGNFQSDAIRILSQKDSGIYDAMNKGLQNFSGDAVGFLNSDDCYHDAFVLERIAAGLENAEAVYGDVIMVSDHLKRRPVRVWQAGSFTPGSFRRGWMPPHPTFYMRRSLADALSNFDLRYRIAADYDLMLRALELHRATVGYIASPLVDFLVGGHSGGLRAVIDGNLECMRSRRTHLGAPALDLALILKPARKLLQLRPFGS